MKKDTIYTIIFLVLCLLGFYIYFKTNILLSVPFFLLAVACKIRELKVWPFNEKIDPRYKTIETMVYSGNYVFPSVAKGNSLNIEYDITLDVVNRDDFICHELLDDKNKDKYLKNHINGKIYSCIACYQVLYEEDGHYRFHKILDINTKNVVIGEAPEHINNIISKIENEICGITTCGVEFTRFNFKRAQEYVPQNYN